MTVRALVVASFASIVLSACAWIGGKSHPVAEARLVPTQGHTASGQVRFVAVDGGVNIEARMNGLGPGGHGFHIHERGDCSAPDATSAGGHFNPTGKAHGHPDKADRHLGDLPMLFADATGRATLTVVARGVSLAGDGNGIVGRAVVVHAAPDDYSTQPAGNSGARVACGVIAAQ